MKTALSESTLDFSESDEDASLDDIEEMIRIADTIQPIPKMEHVQVLK